MDLSFLKFYDSIEQDLFESNATRIALYNDIHLMPREKYLNITNIDGGYILTGMDEFYFVDCKDNILAQASVTVYDLENGQFAWELLENNYDFYEQEVRIRLNKDKWTRPFIYSNYRINETIRIDFKNNLCNLDGTNYNYISIFQSIRLKAWFSQPEVILKTEDYTAMSGINVSARPITTYSSKFVFDYLTNTAYMSLSHALKCDVIYINGKRVTNKPQIELSDSYVLDFNQKKANLKANFDFDDTYQPIKQIYGDYSKLDYSLIDYKTN